MIKVGISQCLTGANVRYDGGHRNSKFCNRDLSDIFEFESFCPEVGIGLPIPRKTIRLVGDIDSPRAVYSDGGDEDFTLALSTYADQHLSQLKALSGFVFCKASPSCGTNRVKVYADNGHSQSKGVGIFAARVQKLLPGLPVEDDGRLNDPLLRDSFIKRVFIFNEWQKIVKEGLTKSALFKFHARHKYTLLAHCQKTYRALGPQIAKVTNENLDTMAKEYIVNLMSGLTRVATRKNNTNVLMHLQGYLKEHLDADDKAELTQCILDYNKGIEPILSPLTLLKHHFKNNPNEYILDQSFLEPYPRQLAIRVATH